MKARERYPNADKVEPFATFRKSGGAVLEFSLARAEFPWWRRLYIVLYVVLVDLPLAPLRLLFLGRFWLWRSKG